MSNRDSNGAINGMAPGGGQYDVPWRDQRSGSFGGNSGAPAQGGASRRATTGRPGMAPGTQPNPTVFGPMTGAGPKNYKRPNDRIEEDVCDRLTQHGYVDARNIQVKVDNGEVTLSGSVPDRGMKERAAQIAESVSGVWNVMNELKIRQDGTGQEQQTTSGGNTPAPAPARPQAAGRTATARASKSSGTTQ